MACGVIIFRGMKVGVLPGDLQVSVDESGVVGSRLILSTAYNVLPIWLRIADDQLKQAKVAKDALTGNWRSNDEGNRELLIREGMLYAVVIGAGFGEETRFLGFMFERLGRLFGPGAVAKTFVVLLAAGLFGLAHYFEQGLPGVQQATIVGLVFLAIFAVTGRIFMLMVAHAAFELTALALIYWNLESAAAHLNFR